MSIKSFALATICRSLCSDLFSVLTQMNNRDARGWGMIAICACGGRRLHIYACHIPKVNQDSRCRTLLIPLLEAEQDLDGSGREEAASWRYPRSANLKSAYLHIFGDWHWWMDTVGTRPLPLTIIYELRWKHSSNIQIALPVWLDAVI